MRSKELASERFPMHTSELNGTTQKTKKSLFLTKSMTQKKEVELCTKYLVLLHTLTALGTKKRPCLDYSSEHFSHFVLYQYRA